MKLANFTQGIVNIEGLGKLTLISMSEKRNYEIVVFGSIFRSKKLETTYFDSVTRKCHVTQGG